MLLTTGSLPIAAQNVLEATTKPINPQFQPLPIGNIKPSGWLKKQLLQNINGFTGYLDSLAADLIIQDELYGKDRLNKKIKSKNLGAIGVEGEWQSQFLWWNSETQSNWWDGYIRTAILIEDQKHLHKVEQYIHKILATQDKDGYLGIYDTDLRYNFNNENGELWAKTTLLRGLIAWYEYTGNKNVLNAIKKAVDNVIAAYPINQSRPFNTVNPNSTGLTHGLVFTDVLESLYRICGNEIYRDYCSFLYKEFSKEVLNEDAQISKLLNKELALSGHGVHTYEHLRSVAAAYYASGNKEYEKALNAFLKKIDNCTLPSGAPAGDEFIGGRIADANNTGYEYCSIHELMDSYLQILSKSGNSTFAEKAETIFFNAAQGARHPEQSGICYLKTDNSYELTGGKNGDITDKHQTRYRYSPVHREAAVCCVPNAGRITPYFVQNMWMRKNDGLVAVLFGACNLNTTVNGEKVSIEEITEYPQNLSLQFNISATKNNIFSIYIRKPIWATSFSCNNQYSIQNEYIVITKNWEGNHQIQIQFHTEALLHKALNGDVYFSYGPQILALSINAKEMVTKTFALPKFKELAYTPVNFTEYYLSKSNISLPMKKENTLKIVALNSRTLKNETIHLVPMGSTILRQVTFKIK